MKLVNQVSVSDNRTKKLVGGAIIHKKLSNIQSTLDSNRIDKVEIKKSE